MREDTMSNISASSLIVSRVWHYLLIYCLIFYNSQGHSRINFDHLDIVGIRRTFTTKAFRRTSGTERNTQTSHGRFQIGDGTGTSDSAIWAGGWRKSYVRYTSFSNLKLDLKTLLLLL